MEVYKNPLGDTEKEEITRRRTNIHHCTSVPSPKHYGGQYVDPSFLDPYGSSQTRPLKSQVKTT